MEDDETVGAGLYPSIGSTKAQHKIFYINPNSTDDMTAEAADYFEDKISPDICVSFYTAPPQAPPSINGTLDAVMSTAVVLEDLGLSSHNPKERAKVLASTFSAVIVGCFSAHPLLPALQEALHFQDSAPPVIGIMEAAIYTALQLAPSFGIVTTGLNWEPLFVTHMRTMGIADSRVAGIKGTGYIATDLHGSDVSNSILDAAEELVLSKGAGAIVLGCAGMAPMREELETNLRARVGKHIYIIDGVQAAIEMAAGMSRMRMSARAV